MSPIVTNSLRGLALFLGTFSLVNVAGGFIRPGFDANVWWLDLRGLAPPVAATAFAATGASLVAWAIVADAARWRLRATRTALWTAAAVASWDAVRAGLLAADGRIGLFPVPFSLLVAAGLVAIDCAIRRHGPLPGAAWHALPAAAAWTVAFALLQMLCFGRTDYARQADAIVVFGARTYADGRPSLALYDRVRTGCELWRDGRAPLLVLSGGPGDGAFHETDAMAALARSEGVPDAAILVDREGTSTQATVEDVMALLRARGLSSALAVSHAYHLPRVKLTFDRAGFAAFTVPARESRSFAKMPLLVAREVAALWAYWIAPGCGG